MATNAPPQTVSAPMMIEAFGYSVNAMALVICILIVGLIVVFWRQQRRQRLDFSDMITKDGTSVSLTKVLQLVGGITATWIMIKLTLTGGLTEAILGIYLAYVASIEGYSKFISAKYKYNEGASANRNDQYAEDYPRPGRYGEYGASYSDGVRRPGVSRDVADPDQDEHVKPPKEL